MTILVPRHVAEALERTGRAPYRRKLPTTGLDYDRMRRAETRRRLRAVKRLGSK